MNMTDGVQMNIEAADRAISASACLLAQRQVLRRRFE